MEKDTQIMDYEKKYNEAMLRADDAVQKGCLDKDVFDIIFPPEESEDERIRRELIEYLRGDLDDITTDDTDRWIAYLEKQKEPEKEELVYRLNGLMQEYINEAKDQEEEEHRFKCYKLFWNALEDTSYFEQKEQKSAEWSEEDETHLGWIIECFDSWKYQVPEFTDQYQSAINWLKSLRPSWKPSEEQMKALQCAIAFMEIRKASDYDISPLKSLYEQLKKL